MPRAADGGAAARCSGGHGASHSRLRGAVHAGLQRGARSRPIAQHFSMTYAVPHRQRRILFVEQFYYPDGWGGAELPLDLTIHLARSGLEVEVICGADQYAPVEGEPPPDPRLHGIRMRRIPALLRGNIHRGKLVRQLWFYLALLPLLLFRRPPDVFVAQTNPPLAVILVAAAARICAK